MAEGRLDALARALTAARPTESAQQAWKRAGFADDEVVALCGQPDASRALLAKSVQAFVIPALPGLVRRIAERAAGGDQAAEKVLLSFLGENSPVREHLGDELTHASPAALEAMARQARTELDAIIRGGGT